MSDAWVKDFKERIQWVVDHKPISRRAWSVKAGLSQSHVGMILRGDIGEEISAKSIHALARAAGVSFAWLVSGVGGPYDTSSSEDDIPERAEGIRFARANGVPEWAIERVAAITGLRGQRTAEQWYERAKFEAGYPVDGEPVGPETFARPRAPERTRGK